MESKKSCISWKRAVSEFTMLSFPQMKGSERYRTYCKLQSVSHEFLKENGRITR